jgi:hypothetical protein
VNCELAHSDSQLAKQQIARIGERAAAVFFDTFFPFAHCLHGQLDIRRVGDRRAPLSPHQLQVQPHEL